MCPDWKDGFISGGEVLFHKLLSKCILYSFQVNWNKEALLHQSIDH